MPHQREFETNQPVKKPIIWHAILDNKVISSLLTVLLVLIIIFIFTKIAYLFTPLHSIFSLFGFPVVTSAVLYYLFAPVVNSLERQGVSKTISVFGIFILLILVISLSIGSLVPIVQNQTKSFVENVPAYYKTLMEMIDNLPFSLEKLFKEFDLQPLLENFSLENITSRLNPIVSSTFGGIGNILGTVTSAVTGLITIPIILYYLLVDAERIPKKILYYVPTKYRQSVSRMLYQGNYQVSQYIRGQIIVAICVAIMFAIGYAIIGLEYGATLAILAGILNIIPFLGSIIAVIPAIIVGLITSPLMLVKVIIVMMVEQTIEGRFISPQVLGNSLKVHPVTILFILLGAGKLFGVVGVIIGVPMYAVVKVIATEIYSWYREASDAYEDDDKYLYDDQKMVLKTIDNDDLLEEAKEEIENEDEGNQDETVE
ncbi:AI-2E family transporter [Tuanshanicoccus lijuaniae]|uniref:AI-2E family transporter n=1 Tax=Aerococcaceae bacterium zg-1292 TaxID=2774330 RepID=UPI001BD8ADE8|nr:AI-2E family transporter [Aerococcaceae bacterium zg-BR9]MBF6977629.1 AI-2E family transporter [Aerococcaceae bacterium zg-BR22]MBS4457029.1 AI-2E family transporter [Aerococcaceae bacterium zg-A91]MBS4458870.1 AI-2E family transporter [Aerococcaceae bacterium zg-BR33]